MNHHHYWHDGGVFVGSESMALITAPIVSNVIVLNAAGSLGIPISIRGLQFSPEDSTLSVRIPAGPCSVTTWLAGTALSCVGSAGAGKSTIAVTVASVAGTLFESFSFDGAASAGAERGRGQNVYSAQFNAPASTLQHFRPTPFFLTQ